MNVFLIIINIFRLLFFETVLVPMSTECIQCIGCHPFITIFLAVHFAFFFTKNNEFLQVLLKGNRVGMVSCNYFFSNFEASCE